MCVGVLQCVAMCFDVLQCVLVCCNVFWCVLLLVCTPGWRSGVFLIMCCVCNPPLELFLSVVA